MDKDEYKPKYDLYKLMKETNKLRDAIDVLLQEQGFTRRDLLGELQLKTLWRLYRELAGKEWSPPPDPPVLKVVPKEEDK